MENAYAQPADQVLQHFEVDEHNGLNDAQITRLREKYGSNGMYSVLRFLAADSS